jgi:hypothetical protein
MTGIVGHSGAVKRIIFSRVMRISLGPNDIDLLQFFEGLDKLPTGKRNAVLLSAIRVGTEIASKMLASEDDELAESAGEFLV